MAGTFALTGLCGSGSPDCGGTSFAYAGSTAACTYGDNEWGELALAPVTLSYGPSALRFCSRLGSEADYDFATVSVNGQQVWQQAGGDGSWVEEMVDLSDFGGAEVAGINVHTMRAMRRHLGMDDHVEIDAKVISVVDLLGLIGDTADGE